MIDVDAVRKTLTREGLEAPDDLDAIAREEELHHETLKALKSLAAKQPPIQNVVLPLDEPLRKLAEWVAAELKALREEVARTKPPVVRNTVDVTQIAEVVRKSMEREPPVPQVTVQAPQVTVTPMPAEPPVIKIDMAAVERAVLKVLERELPVPQVNVPQQKTPVVKVQPATPIVHVVLPRVRKVVQKVLRDAAGEMTGTEQIYEYEDE